MRTMMRGKHGKISRFPALAALALCTVLIVTFMPNLMFSANAEDENKIVTQITALAETTLTAPTGTSEEAVKKQLPISLSAKIRQADNTEKDETINGITWSSDQYQSDSAGTYKFTSGLPSGYQLAEGVSMPSVNVTVRVVKEVESESGTSVDSGKIFGTRKSTVTQFTYPTNESLGSVGKYGVFARSYTQTGDMEGSVATEHLDANANIGRSSSVQSYDPTESYDYIGDFTKTFRSHAETAEDWIFGNTVTLDNHYNNENGFRATCNGNTISWNGINELGSSVQNVSDSPYQINFDNAFNGLIGYAENQYGKEDTDGVTVDNTVEKEGVDQNEYAVTIKCTEGAHIINLTANDLQKGKIKVTGPANGNYSLIINIRGLSENNYSFTKDVEIDGEKTGFSPKIGHVVFNFGLYNGTINYPGNNYAGVILAPNASVKFSGGHHAGSVYANTIESSVEIHQIDFIPSTPVTPTYPSIAFAVKKSFDGNYPDEKTFTFTLSGGKVENGKITNNITKTATVDDRNSLNKNVPFESITYQDKGTYKYTVSENIPNNADDHHISEGVKYDPTVYDVEVVTSKESVGNVKIDTVKYKKSSDTEYKQMDISNPEAFTFSNSSAPSSTTSVSVKKVWNDNNNQDGKRPDSIQLHLYADGTEVTSKAQTISGNSDTWSYSFTDLPKSNKDGKEINYTVKEDPVTGYESSGDATKENNFTITNTHTPETTFVSGNKTWDDKNNQDGKRPKSITVNLLKNGEKIKSTIVDSSNDWQYSFANLPKYDNGKEIKYTITEDAVADYSTKVDGYDITNSYTPGKTSVTVTKAWLDNNNADKKRPASIQVQLYADGKPSSDPVTITAKDNWTHTWSGLNAKKSGTDIKYTVEEVKTPDGYTSNVSGDAKTGYNITNTEDKTTPPTPVTPTYTTYTVHKVWDLGSGETVPDSVQMQLYKNGAAYGVPVKVTGASGWTYTWTVLPQTENGKLNTWSVKEVDPDNQYTATVVNGTSSATVTNRSNNNAGGKTQVSVHKVWKLDNGRTAASSVQAQLYRNGEAYGDPVTLSAGNSWSHVWTGLTKTDAQGNTISWTVREVNVPSGFTSTVTGTDRSFTITNDDKPQDNHNKHNNSEHPNNNNNKNNKPVYPSNHNKNNTTVHPGTPSIPKNTGTVANRGTTAGSTPRTGDQTSLGFWLAMLTAGAAGTAAAVLLKRRNRKEEE